MPAQRTLRKMYPEHQVGLEGSSELFLKCESKKKKKNVNLLLQYPSVVFLASWDKKLASVAQFRGPLASSYFLVFSPSVSHLAWYLLLVPGY